MPGWLPKQCPSGSLPVTFLLLARVYRPLSSQLHCSAKCQSSVMGGKGDGDIKGTGGRGAAGKTLPRCCDRALGWVAMTWLGMVSLSLQSQPSGPAEAGGTAMLCPALHSGHLPLLCQHCASASLHPGGTFPPGAALGMCAEVAVWYHCH